MDKGLVLVLGVLLGTAGTALLLQLLLLVDEDGQRYFSDLTHRLGVRQADVPARQNREHQESRPGRVCGSTRPGNFR